MTPAPAGGKRKGRKSPSKDELCQIYARGSYVWAKIHGFPWWPSQVRSNKAIHNAEPKVRVRFCFTNDDATLPLEQLAVWSAREAEEPSKMKIKSKVRRHPALAAPPRASVFTLAAPHVLAALRLTAEPVLRRRR